MARPRTIPQTAWDIWRELFDRYGPDAVIPLSTWEDVAKRHADIESRQGLHAYRSWLEENGFVEGLFGGVTLAWGHMEHSWVSERGLFSRRPGDGVHRILPGSEARQLGLWNPENGEDSEDWEPVGAFSFPTKDIRGWGQYLRKKAEFLKDHLDGDTRFLEEVVVREVGEIERAYLEDVHHYFLNSLGQEIGDVVTLEDWRLVLGHDYGSVITDAAAERNHSSTALEVFSRLTKAAELLGLVTVVDEGIRLERAPRKTPEHPTLEPSPRYRWRDTE